MTVGSRAPGFRTALILQLLLATRTFASSQDSCEQRDGNCPLCLIEGYNGTINFNARFDISPDEDNIGRRAAKAQSYIGSQGEVDRFDDPWTNLHTTLFYFCCHTEESAQGVLDAMQAVEWSPIHIHYDTFGCNLGMSATNSDTVYLHSMPGDEGQAPLFELARKIENAVYEAGWWINHPRRSLFHMTLARVGYEYPTDEVVSAFESNGTDFGTARMASFTARVRLGPVQTYTATPASSAAAATDYSERHTATTPASSGN